MLCCGLCGLCHIYSATISVLIGLILANKKDPVSKLLNFFDLKEIKIKTKAVSTYFDEKSFYFLSANN